MYTSIVECFGIQIPVLKVMGLNPIGITFNTIFKAPWNAPTSKEHPLGELTTFNN